MQAINLHTIFPIIACCVAAAEQPASIESFCAGAHEFAATLNTALETLQQIDSREEADAAVPAILAVHEGQERMRRLAKGHELPKLWQESDVRLALRSIPAPQFTEAVRAEQAGGCHGSVRLFLALHNRLSEFTEEQMEAPLSEADAATLREVEACFNGAKDVLENYWYMDKYYIIFLQHLKAAAPGVPALQKSPAAAMRYAQLVEQHRPVAEEFRRNHFRNRGEVEEQLIVEGNNFYTDLYTEESCRRYFASGQITVDYDVSSAMYAEQQLQNRVWTQYEPAILAAAAKRGLTGGNGRNAKTAFELPPELERSKVQEYVNDFAREVFGERFAHSDARPKLSRATGRYVVQAVGIAGRPKDKNVNNDKVQVIAVMFNMPKNIPAPKNNSVQVYSKSINPPQQSDK